MATVIDELMITMGLDGSDVKKGMKDVEGSVSGFVNNIKSNILSIGGAFAGLYAVQQTFTEYLSEADSLLKFSRAIGQNVEDIDAAAKDINEKRRMEYEAQMIEDAKAILAEAEAKGAAAEEG
jgi:hemerythrin superfamily protein